MAGTKAWFVIHLLAGSPSREQSRHRSVAASRALQRLSHDLGGLHPNESVTVMLYAKLGRIVSHGKRVTFRTPGLPVATLAATSITATSAVIHGTANPNGEHGISGAFRWSVANGGTPQTTTGTPLRRHAQVQAFGSTLSGLSPNTQYQFDAVATAPSGLVLACGCTLKFTTAQSLASTNTPLDTSPPSSNASSPQYSNLSSFTVSYTASDSGSGLAKVDLYATGPTDSGYAKVASDSSASGSGSFSYTATEGNGSYSFYTLATDRAGNTQPTPSSPNSRTLLDMTAPSAPTNPSTTGGNGQVSLTWDASTDNVGVAGYYILRNGVSVATVTTTSYTDVGLTNGITYSYEVEAFDAAGNVSHPSNTAVATPQAVTLMGGAPALRYMYDDSSASAGYGFNLMDVGGKSGSDGTPSGTRGLVWLGNYDNSTCQFQVSDAQIQADLAGAAGDSKIAGYFLADEPDPNACPNAPAQIAARSQLVHRTDTDPSHFTLMVMDSNSGSVSLNQVPLWKGVTDYVGLDPYPCYQNQPCKFSWIDQIISAANSAGLNYWGIVQAFNDSTWRWPTADELTHMLNQWAASNETGYGVFAWTWSANNLTSQPSLLSVLQKFNATASADTTAPGVPAGLTATSGNQQMSLSWTASADPDDAVASYYVYRDGVYVGSSTTSSFTDAALTNGTAYSYQVTAVDTHGNESALSNAVAATPQAPSPPHIMEIVMENHSVGAVVGNASAPFQNSLTTNHITLTNWSSVDHPSAPNYVALVTGADNGQAGAGDCNPSIGGSCNWAGDNFGNQLFTAGIPATWFAEDLSSNGCSISNSKSGNNDVNHEPWAYMDMWQANPGACAQAGLTTTSPSDSEVISALNGATPPDYVWVTPNLTDDTHNGTVAQGDNYLQNLITAVQATHWYAQDGTIIITYDEDEGTSPPQGGTNPAGYCANVVAGSDSTCIATFIISAKDANVGAVATPGNHYGLLRSLEECYGVPLLNKAAAVNSSGQAAYGDIKNRLC
jgi:chitodextrinase